MISLLAPLGLIALVGVPLVVLLYMRHSTPLVRPVPTLRFWLAAQPEQTERLRFRRPPLSLLLILHVLLVALIAFALTRPATSRALGRLDLRTEPRHEIILLDGSTSMSATDTPSGRTRWEDARRLALAKVAGLHEGDVATVVVLGTRTETLAGTDAGSLKALRGRLATLDPPGGRADLNAALRLTKDLLLPNLDNRVTLISDGALAVDPGLAGGLGAPIAFERVGGAGHGLTAGNVAVTAISARATANNPNALELFVQVTNFEAQQVTAPVVLTADGIEFGSKTATIAANGGSTELSWPLPQGAKRVSAQVNIHDALAADNTASLVVQQQAGLSLKILLVSNTPNYLQKALAALPGVQLTTVGTDSPQLSASSAPYDLVVYDGWTPSPDQLADAPLLFVHPPLGGPFPSNGQMTAPTLASVHAEDPLLNGVDLSGVTFGPTPIFTLDAEESAVAGAQQGPLIFRGTLHGHAFVALAFDINQSNLPQRPAFPILIFNAAAALAPSSLPPSVPLGDPLIYRPRASAATVRIAPPHGDPIDLSVAVAGQAKPGKTAQPTAAADETAAQQRLRQIAFADTGQPGTYTVTELDANGQSLGGGQFVVNAGHPTESDLRPNPELGPILATAKATGAGSIHADLADLWPLIAAAILALLIFEWAVTLFSRPRAASHKPTSRQPAAVSHQPSSGD